MAEFVQPIICHQVRPILFLKKWRQDFMRIALILHCLCKLQIKKFLSDIPALPA